MMESTTPVGQRCARCGHVREGHGTRYAAMFGDHTWTNAHGFPDPLEEPERPATTYRSGRVPAVGQTAEAAKNPGTQPPSARPAGEPWWRRILGSGT